MFGKRKKRREAIRNKLREKSEYKMKSENVAIPEIHTKDFDEIEEHIDEIEQEKEEKQKKYIGGLPMGISILIVDDDKLLVEKLEETVNWSGIGIDMVFTANNIRQAQKLLEEYPIEMLLCDIDMPQGNGLELLEWIRYKKLDIECTFLSSYANFAYAQMALKLSSREYLLKPISNVDLETALRRIVGIVQEKHQKQKKQEKQEKPEEPQESKKGSKK